MAKLKSPDAFAGGDELAARRAHAGQPSLAKELRESGETEVDAITLELRADRDDLRFLGREFLTWLLFHADTGEGTFAGPDGAFEIGFGERLQFKSLGATVDETVLKGDSPGDSADARFAVAGGLSLREADLVLVHGKHTFQFGLGADGFDLKRVKLPEVLGAEGDHAEDLAAERLMLLDDLDACVAAAFAHFLRLRLASAWSKETVPAIRSWLEDALARE